MTPSKHQGGGLGQSPSPWGTLISARPVTDFRAYFTVVTLIGISKWVIWNFFQNPSIHLGGVMGPPLSSWGTPTSARRDWFSSIYHRRDIVWHGKISNLKLYPDPLHTSGWSSGAIPNPMRNPNISKAKDGDIFILKLVIWNFFMPPPYIWVEAWGHLHPLLRVGLFDATAFV